MTRASWRTLIYRPNGRKIVFRDPGNLPVCRIADELIA